MGEWGWVVVGYVVTVAGFGFYTTWLKFRLRRVEREVQEVS